MKKFIRPIAGLIALLILCSVFYSCSFSTVVEGGECGDVLTWTYTTDANLTISGIEKMTDYSIRSNGESGAPWNDFKELIISVDIYDGVESIGTAAFCGLDNLLYAKIPESVKQIGEYAFYGCDSLMYAVIPDGAVIGESAFADCSGFLCMIFLGKCTFDGTNIFEGVSAELYYPENTEGWDQYVDNDFGGDLTWISYADINDLDPNIEQILNFDLSKNLKTDIFSNFLNFSKYIMGDSDLDIQLPDLKPQISNPRHNSLDELTEIDYLAFSQLAYTLNKDVLDGTTVKEMVDIMVKQGKWSDRYKKLGITTDDLFKYIYEWKVYDSEEFTYRKTGNTLLDYVEAFANAGKNGNSGFAAYAFVNDKNEYVIAFRGSERDGVNDVVTDWVKTDIASYLGDNDNQFAHAMFFAQAVINADPAEVHVTGHSLGGALADIVSAQHGFKGVTFNPAGFLSNAYYYYPKQMGEHFEGVDKFNFEDHVTNGDHLIGMTRYEFKNMVLHEVNRFDNVYFFEPHSMESMLEWKNGEVSLTRIRSQGRNNQVTSRFDLYLGTSGDDEITSKGIASTVFGGVGHDTIVGGIWDDTIIGGKGHDNLHGGGGDDSYYYFCDDGVDLIYDSGGDDKLYIIGFSGLQKEDIEAIAVDNCVTITAGGVPIASISKDRAWFSSFSIVLVPNTLSKEEKTIDISDLFKKRNIGKFIEVACPVNVEIIEEATGNTVYTLYDGADGVGSFYTDYGYLYVYEDENGEYVKRAILFEGYDIKIVGIGEGTMDVSVFDIKEDGSFTENVISDTPVSLNTVAILGDSNDLLIDSDNDGEFESSIVFTEVRSITFDSNNINGDKISQTAEYGKKFELPDVMFESIDGVDFKGWDINGEIYKPGKTITVEENISAKAVWKVNKLDSFVNTVTENKDNLIICAAALGAVVVIVTVCICKKRKKSKKAMNSNK